MRSVVHRLVGYHYRRETLEFSADIPLAFLSDVRKLLDVNVDGSDPQMLGCYELPRKLAKRIATILGVDDLPINLTFFVEPFLVPMPVMHHADVRP